MRDSQLEPDDGTQDPQPQHGRLGTTRPGTLAAVAAVGLLLGRLLRPVAISLDLVPPRVGWSPVLALALAAAIMAGAAWLTHRARRRPRGLLPHHQAVNRLVLAKACSLAGTFVAGGYAGYALSWAGTRAELGEERLLHSVLAAAAAAALAGAALALERACRLHEPTR